MNQTKTPRNITLLLTSTMTVMAGATIAPSLPGMEAHFANTPNAQFWVQMVMTTPGLMIALTAPFIGWLLDKSQKKSLLVVAMLAYGVSGTAGYFLDDTLAGLLASRVALGIAVAGIMVTCTTLIGDYYQGPERGHYMGLLAAFGAFGGVVFVAAGGALAAISWQAPFLIYALVFAVLPAVLLLIHEPQRVPPPPPAQAGNEQKGFIAFCFAFGLLEVFILYAIPVHLPFFAQGLNAGSVQAGFLIAFMLLVMAGVASFYQRVKGQRSFQALQCAGLALVAAGFLLLAWVKHLPMAYMAMLVMGTGFGLMRPNLVMWLMACTPPHLRGRLMGGLTSCFFVGQFICPIVTLPLVTYFGQAGVFMALALLAACAALAVALIRRSPRRGSVLSAKLGNQT